MHRTVRALLIALLTLTAREPRVEQASAPTPRRGDRECGARPATGGGCHTDREWRGGVPADRIDGGFSRWKLVLRLVRDATQGNRLCRQRRWRNPLDHADLQVAPA